MWLYHNVPNKPYIYMGKQEATRHTVLSTCDTTKKPAPPGRRFLTRLYYV